MSITAIQPVGTTRHLMPCTTVTPVHKSCLDAAHASFSTEEVGLFKNYQLFTLIRAYKNSVQQREKRDPTAEELRSTFSDVTVKTIYDTAEAILQQSTPEQKEELKKLLQEALQSTELKELTLPENSSEEGLILKKLERLPVIEQSHSWIALGCGIMTGIATTLGAASLGSYISSSAVARVTGAKAYLGAPSSNFLLRALSYPVSGMMYLVQGAAVVRRSASWIGQTCLAGKALFKLLQVHQVPKPLQDHIGMGDVNILKGAAVLGTVAAAPKIGSEIYSGIADYVNNQDSAISNEFGIILRDKITKLTHSAISNIIHYARSTIPENTGQTEQVQRDFKEGCAIGSQATVAGLFAMAMGASAYIVAPIALGAGALTYALVKDDNKLIKEITNS